MAQAGEPPIDPSDEEIEAWAAREQRRRVQWLAGPTREQAALWASRERQRRIGGADYTRTPLRPGIAPAQLMLDATRNLRLAAEGALSLLFRSSPRNAFDYLVQAGREWEDGLSSEAAPSGPLRRLCVATIPRRRPRPQRVANARVAHRRHIQSEVKRRQSLALVAQPGVALMVAQLHPVGGLYGSPSSGASTRASPADTF